MGYSMSLPDEPISLAHDGAPDVASGEARRLRYRFTLIRLVRQSHG